MMQYFVFVLGIACLLAAVWERRGTPQTRAWVANSAQPKDKKDTGPIVRDERFALLGLPSMGVFYLVLGCLQLSILPGGWLATILFAICVILLALSFLGLLAGIVKFLPFPRQLRPVWLRKHYEELGIDPKV